MSSTHQGFLRHVKMPPGLFRRGLNLSPPFFGAGVRVTRVSDDYREVEATARGAAHEPTLHVAIVDKDGEPIAEVDKTLYVRRRPEGVTHRKRAARAKA